MPAPDITSRGRRTRTGYPDEVTNRGPLPLPIMGGVSRPVAGFAPSAAQVQEGPNQFLQASIQAQRERENQFQSSILESIRNQALSTTQFQGQLLESQTAQSQAFLQMLRQIARQGGQGGGGGGGGSGQQGGGGPGGGGGGGGGGGLGGPLSNPNIAPFQFIPIRGISLNEIAGFSDWGDSRDGGARSHEGIDLMAPTGTPIRAMMRGRITLGSGGLAGNWFEINNRRHNMEIFGAHLASFHPNVQSGDRVRPGQIIGYVGHSGNASSNAPHLHLEIQPGGNSVNPEPYIRRLYRAWYRRRRRRNNLPTGQSAGGGQHGGGVASGGGHQA